MFRAKCIILFAVLALGTPTLSFAASIRTCFIGLNLRDGGAEEATDNSAARAASAVVRTARDQLHHVDIALARQFTLSPDAKTATLGALQAFTNYQLAKKAGLGKMRLSPAGIGAQIVIERLEHQLDDARREASLAGVEHSDKIDSLAMELLRQRSAVTHREAAVLSADQKLATLRYA